MNKYVTKTGQNIYDIAITLYGSIEGIYDLLLSNPSISLTTIFPKGTTLHYHEEFIINSSIPEWFEQNNLIVKNGVHTFDNTSISSKIVQLIEKSIDGALQCGLSRMTINVPKPWHGEPDDDDDE